jgi:serine/threonine-protein kinase
MVDDEPGVVLPQAGYELGDVIGRGGMGEVIAAHDRRMGREVALKRMHGSASPRAIARFLREARIQARLDHPAIVPVHELAVDDDGRPYFTMKRLAGRTLEAALEAGEPTPRLLRAFTEVCLAISLAHDRGVVHRDLKPANIMLGDYGEVYVLDWGIARLVSSPASLPIETLAADPDAAEAPPTLAAGATKATVAPEVSSSQLATRIGAMLGTPGYAAPEQVRGEPVGPPADIYALGAVLFEILTGTPLHPDGDAGLVSTLASDVEGPSRRAPERAIPPELDELCLQALADDVASRPTAPELARRLQRYLDGDRDLERRRAVAAEQLALVDTAADRASALRHAGRALALDPESPVAAAAVTRLLVERPRELPAELDDELASRDREALATRSRRAARSYLVAFALLLVLPLLGVHSWPTWLGAAGALAFMVVFAAYGARRGHISPYLSMAGNAVLALAWTRIVSPLVLVPAMVCGAGIAIASHPWNQRRPWTIFAWATVTIALPFVLEAVGVFASTWSVRDGGLVIESAIVELRGGAATGFVLATHSIFILLVAGFALTVTRRALTAERELHVQAWHLRHLLPEPAPQRTK